MFRQHSIHPDEVGPRKQRHWLMDDPTSRELLKTAAVRCDPMSKLPWFGTPTSIDHEIEPFIDKLDLRSLEEPSNLLDREFMDIYLLWRTTKALLIGR